MIQCAFRVLDAKFHAHLNYFINYLQSTKSTFRVLQSETITYKMIVY